MAGSGVVVSRDSLADRERAHAAGVELVVSASWNPPWEKTLFVREPARVPWDLVGFGFDLLDRWDLAAPFDRSGALADACGTELERSLTAEVVGDLRQPAISCEVVFVRWPSPFLVEWRNECDRLPCPRLAFLRALHMAKPRFCALPRVWLADASERARIGR